MLSLFLFIKLILGHFCPEGKYLTKQISKGKDAQKLQKIK